MSWRSLVGLTQRAALRVFDESASDPVLYHAGGAGSVAVQGIYREAGVGVDVGLAEVVRTETPELHVRIEDLFAATGASEITEADEVTVRGVRRRVGEFDVDGEGMAVLYLKEGLA